MRSGLKPQPLSGSNCDFLDILGRGSGSIRKQSGSASGSFGISYEISYVKFHLKFRRAFLFAVFLIGIFAVPRLCVVSALRARRARRAAPTAQGTPRGFTSGSRPEAIRKHFLTFFGCLLDVCCRFLGFLLLLQLSRLL